jgi:hypothetical protein
MVSARCHEITLPAKSAGAPLEGSGLQLADRAGVSTSGTSTYMETGFLIRMWLLGTLRELKSHKLFRRSGEELIPPTRLERAH